MSFYYFANYFYYNGLKCTGSQMVNLAGDRYLPMKSVNLALILPISFRKTADSGAFYRIPASKEKRKKNTVYRTMVHQFTSDGQ